MLIRNKTIKNRLYILCLFSILTGPHSPGSISDEIERIEEDYHTRVSTAKRKFNQAKEAYQRSVEDSTPARKAAIIRAQTELMVAMDAADRVRRDAKSALVRGHTILCRSN